MSKRKRITTTTEGKQAIGYVRVSTGAQVRDGVSLEQQRSKVHQYAELHGFELGQVYADEGISAGRADNRPGLQAALDAVCKARGVLIVHDLTRFARSTQDAITLTQRLEKCGADLASIREQIDTTSGMGRFVFRLMASLGELERDQISERVKAAMDHKRAKGERIGRHIPFGFDLAPNGVALLPNKHEQSWLQQIEAWRVEGMSIRAIAGELTRRKVPTKQGRARWAVSTVAAILGRLTDG